jgi:hypothetical protein
LTSIGGGVISYALDGKQYVATTSGTVAAFFGGSGLPAVVVFAAESGESDGEAPRISADRGMVFPVR